MPRRAVFLLAALLALPARAAAPVQPAGLVKMLSEGLTGRAVMGAGVGYAGPKAASDPAALKQADSLLDKCQVIAAAASIGLRRTPNTGYSAPAATGTPSRL